MYMAKIERINQSENPLVGQNIKRLRIQNDMRNVDVTSRLQLMGVKLGSSTLSKIESGQTNPPVDVLMALTKVLHCDYNALFYKEGADQEDEI